MIAANSFNLKGEAGDKVALPKELFGTNVSPDLLAQAVRVYLANQRQAGAKTKTRGQVAKTTAKMYRQKGTGRARHGSYAAPIFVGGGIAHGPDGEQNYKLRVPKKIRRLAIVGALSERAREKKVVVIKEGAAGANKTKQIRGVWKRVAGPGGLLLVVGKSQNEMGRAWRNLAGVRVVGVENLNPYIILAHANLLVTTKAVEEIKERYAD